MLVLSRYPKQSLVFNVGGIEFEVTVNDIEFANGRVRLGIEAPPEVSVTRKELVGTGRDLPRNHSHYRPRGGIGWGE